VSGTRQPSLCRRIVHSARSWPRAKFSTFDLVPDGFVFTTRSVPKKVFWDEIIQIDAGMRDYLTVDMFFAVIRTSDEKLEIDELADGFRLLESSVFTHWPQIRNRWLALQASPHHHPQFETLWKR